jgi:endoglucanase
MNYRPWLVALVMSLGVFWSTLLFAVDWQAFKKDFLSEDGRVIDHYQHQRSHSEGQGYGLLLAIGSNDREAFDLIWAWTKNNLQVRESDHLFAWSWGNRDGSWSVLDYNNATDGDQLIAWALFQAYERWGIEEYRESALEITDSIRELLVWRREERSCLIPGYYGFDADKSLVLNPSYFIFTALQKFADYDRKDFWENVYQDSLTILKESLVSPLELPPDWIRLNAGKIETDTTRSEKFGFEAIRIPLYLAWDKRLDAVPGINGLLDLTNQLGFVPLWVNLVQAGTSLEPGPAGFQAVMARVAEDSGRAELARSLWENARSRAESEKENYYSRVLYLLARLEFSP